MKQVISKKKFVKDSVKYAKNNPKIIADLRSVVKMLQAEQELPARYRDHPLIGNWNGHMECHIRPDVLLIYRSDDTTIELVRLGSHAELFK